MSTKTGDDKFAMPAMPDFGTGTPSNAGALSGLLKPARTTRLQRVLHGVRLLLVAVWLGGAVFFSAAVAPSAFAVLPSRELAGALVARTLAILNVGGFAIGLLLLLGAFVGRKGARLVALLVELLALAAMTGAAFVGHFVIAARMASLRGQMGKPIEEVAADDALRVAFNALHGQSVTTMTVAIAAAAVALFLIARRIK